MTERRVKKERKKVAGGNWEGIDESGRKRRAVRVTRDETKRQEGEKGYKGRTARKKRIMGRVWGI